VGMKSTNSQHPMRRKSGSRNRSSMKDTVIHFSGGSIILWRRFFWSSNGWKMEYWASLDIPTSYSGSKTIRSLVLSILKPLQQSISSGVPRFRPIHIWRLKTASALSWLRVGLFVLKKTEALRNLIFMIFNTETLRHFYRF